MHSILAVFAVGCSIAQSAAASGIAPYNAEVASSLSNEGALLSDATVAKLLNVIAEHGLENDYGVYSVHEHFNYSKGQAPYEVALSPSLSFTKVVDYSTIADSSIPIIFGVTPNTESLVPIEFVAKTTEAEASYSALTAAVSNGFINDYVKTIESLPKQEQPAVGLAMLTELTKGVLADPSHYVLVQANPANNVKLATLKPVDEAATTGKSTSRPTLFGLSHKAGPVILTECDECIFHMDD